MKLRTGIAALALAVAAPLLTTVPATAKAPVDAIDPVALAGLKAALVSSDQQLAEQGGTLRQSYHGKLLGKRLTTLMVHETDATGASRVRIRGLGQRATAYGDRSGKVVAISVPARLRHALAKHGLHRVPSWYAPGRAAVGGLPPADIGGTVDLLDDGLVALSAVTDGGRTTYLVTDSTDLGEGMSLRTETTVVAEHDLLTSVTQGNQTTTVSYGHAPITAPKADRTHRRLILAESSLAAQADLLSLIMPRHKSRDKRVAWLRATLERLTDKDARGRGMTVTVQDAPGGVRVTGTIKSWKHPLTWRYLVTKKGITARPVRTV